jgi:hypothetical protein
VEFVSRLASSTDIVHLFLDRKAELEKALVKFRAKLKPEGTVWVSWPKKSAGVPTDITEDTVWALARPLGFVDVKVCAVDEVWSGPKLVVRKERAEGHGSRRRPGPRADGRGWGEGMAEPVPPPHPRPLSREGRGECSPHPALSRGERGEKPCPLPEGEGSDARAPYLNSTS